MPRPRRAPWIGREKGQHNYYVYWYEPHTGRIKRRSCGTVDRGEAEKELGRFLIERAYETKNETPILTPDNYLIVTALRWYAQEHGPEITNQEFLGRAIETLVKFFGQNAAVSSITPEVCKRVCRERKRKTRYYRRLTSAPKIWLPPEPPNKTRYLEREEIDALMKVCVEPHIRLFVLLALNTGARKGALLDLMWQQIDFNNRLIYLNPEGRAQTNKKRAVVPINDVLMQALTDQREKLKEEREKAEQENKPVPQCPNVITFKANPLQDIKIGFRAACRRAGLSGVTPHTLRHTAGTQMALAGIDLFLIARLLGHSVQKTTELYAHLHPDYLRGAVSTLGNLTPMVKLFTGSQKTP